MFTLDAPIVAQTAFGGGNGLPPVKDTRPYAIPRHGNNAPKPVPVPVTVTSAPVTPIARPAYPKARAATERRIALCERHHARFLRWRAANIAKLQAWVMSQPGYDATQALCDAYDATLRAALRARRAGYAKAA